MSEAARRDPRSRDPEATADPASAAIVAVGVAALALGLLLGAAVAGEPVLALAAGTVVLVGVAAFARPDTATLVVIGLLYSNAAVVAVSVHGAPFIVAAALPVPLLAPLAYHLLVRRETVVITPALPFILAYLCIQLVSAFASNDPRGAATEVGVFATQGLALYLFVTNVVRTPAMLRQVVWTLLLVGAFLGGVSLLQQLTATTGNNYLGFGQTDSTFGTGSETLAGEVRQARLAGPIGEQNRYAQIMLMLVPLGVMQFFAEQRLVYRTVVAGATLLAAMGSTLGFSRGAYVGFALLIVVMVILRYIRVRHLAAILVGVLLITLVIPTVGARLETLNPIVAVISDEPNDTPDNSVLSRATENLAALLVFVDHPMLGVGPGQFPVYYREYASRVGLLTKAEDREAHNLYLGIAAEVGLLGSVAFLGGVFVTLRALARARRRWLTHRPDLALTATGFSLALMTYLTTGIFLHLSYARYFWLMLALAGAAAFVALHEPEGTERVRTPLRAGRLPRTSAT